MAVVEIVPTSGQPAPCAALPDFDGWEAFAETLSELVGQLEVSQWTMAALMDKGDRKLSKHEFEQACTILNRAPKTVKKWIRVWREFENRFYWPSLSFSHYEAVVYQDQKVQDQLLTLAVKSDLSEDQLSEQVKALKPVTEKPEKAEIVGIDKAYLFEAIGALNEELPKLAGKGKQVPKNVQTLEAFVNFAHDKLGWQG